MKIFSEIFKYDPQLLKFVQFQKLATNGAVSIQSFSFLWETSVETFIIVINKYVINNKNEYHTNSVVYKSEGGKLFVPFQNIIENDVEKWLPLTVFSKTIYDI